METKVRRIFIGVALLVVTIYLASPAYPEAIKVKLKEGSFVPLRIKQSISSEDCSRDQYVDFEVTQDVKVNGYVVIKPGATVRAQVDECVKSGIAGQAGRLRIVLISVKSVDDQNIPLRGTASRVGEEKTMEAIGGGMLCAPLILKKGESSSYPAGTEFQAFTAGDREIVVEKIK